MPSFSKQLQAHKIIMGREEVLNKLSQCFSNPSPSMYHLYNPHAELCKELVLFLTKYVEDQSQMLTLQ